MTTAQPAGGSTGDPYSTLFPNGRVRVGYTSIGRGVLAVTQFLREDIIGQVVGHAIEDAEFGSEYCVDMGDYSLEPVPPFRFLNHSCEPNAALVVYEDQPEKLFIEATTHIEPGQAVTIDYSWPAEFSIPCHCNAVRCRGWIVDKKELHRVGENGC